MTLVLAICETCPASEVDSMISVLLNLFDSRVSLLSLVKLMIDREVSRTGMRSLIYHAVAFSLLSARKRSRSIPKQFDLHQISFCFRPHPRIQLPSWSDQTIDPNHGGNASRLRVGSKQSCGSGCSTKSETHRVYCRKIPGHLRCIFTHYTIVCCIP